MKKPESLEAYLRLCDEEKTELWKAEHKDAAKADIPTCPVCGEGLLREGFDWGVWYCTQECGWTQPDARQRPRKPDKAPDGYEFHCLEVGNCEFGWLLRPAAKPAASPIMQPLPEGVLPSKKVMEELARASIKNPDDEQDNAKPAAPTEKKPVVKWWRGVSPWQSVVCKTVDGIIAESSFGGVVGEKQERCSWHEILESEYLAATGKKQEAEKPAAETRSCENCGNGPVASDKCREKPCRYGEIWQGHSFYFANWTPKQPAPVTPAPTPAPAPKPIKVGDVIRPCTEEGRSRFDVCWCDETIILAKLKATRFSVDRLGDVEGDWLRANCEFRRDGCDGTRVEDWEVRQ